MKNQLRFKMEVISGQQLQYINGSFKSSEEILRDKKFVGFFYSASWCPPCRVFTAVLKDFYEHHARENGLEIVSASFDKKEDEMLNYMARNHGNWPFAPFNSDVAKKLKLRFTISSIPTLIIVDVKSGKMITRDGKKHVEEKKAEAFEEWNSTWSF